MSSTKIEPKETRYKKCRFRSRLEARWAVYFDALGIQWEYEKEGYDLPCGAYLPDFWLPQVDSWAEVKAAQFTQQELTKCFQLHLGTLKPVILLSGLPRFAMFPAIERAEFNHGAWDIEVVILDLAEGHEYWKWEHRFYTDPGWDAVAYGDIDNPEFGEEFVQEIQVQPVYAESSIGELAIAAARSARFEFGESG